jgi:hypothetical protein
MSHGYPDRSHTIGKRYPLDLHAHRDPQTGATAQRFVHRSPSQEQLFYYCSPAISDDGRYLPCYSNVSGSWQVHAIDRQENVSVQLSAMSGPNARSADWCDHFCFSREYNRVFYHDSGRVFWSDVITGENGWLFQAPPDFTMSALSARGKYVAFSIIERMPLGTLPEGKRFGHYPQLCYRPRSIVIAIDIETGNADHVWGDYSYLGHVEMCPFDDNLIMFTDQSWTRRQQEVHVVDRAFAEDKRARAVLAGGFADYRGRTMDYIGHCFFTQDGFIAGQYVEMGNVDARNRYTDRSVFNVAIKPDGTAKRKAKHPGRDQPTHVHCQRADGLWVGDCWIKPDGSMDMAWISLMRNRFDTQEMTTCPLFRTGHRLDRPWHEHPWINSAEDQVVLAYNSGKNDNHMAIIEIPSNLRSALSADADKK